MLTLNISGFTPEEALELIYTGLQVRREWVLARIADLNGQLAATPRPKTDENGPKPPKTAPAPAKHHNMSKKSREAIAEAQRKRWAKHHRLKNAEARARAAAAAAKSKPKPKKVRFSPLPPAEAAGSATSE